MCAKGGIVQGKRMGNMAYNDGNAFQYRVIRSDRRTVALQISPDGVVTVRCPRRMGAETIREFVKSKSAWIEKHLTKKAEQPRLPAFSDGEIQSLVHQAREVLPKRVAFYAGLVGVTYGNVTIRTQRTRWGSCSSKGNLNFNCLLMLVPPEVMDYVVVHELCHRKEMNHSSRFWAEVAAVLPDYGARKQWLREHGSTLIGRLQP